MNEKTYIAGLEGEKEYCQLSNYKKLLFGKDNPLNPFTIKAKTQQKGQPDSEDVGGADAAS